MKIKGIAHPHCRHIIDVKKKEKKYINVNPSGLGWITRLKDITVVQ